MDKKILGVIAAVGALAPIGAAQAGASNDDGDQIMRARSFAELLRPIPNAVARLKAVDEAQPPIAETMVAQYHHHHHHHHYYRHHHHHHFYHHHHHHYYHHHHHHHQD